MNFLAQVINMRANNTGFTISLLSLPLKSGG